MSKYKKFIKELGQSPSVHSLKVRAKFPELFEVKLEVGKWHKWDCMDEDVMAFMFITSIEGYTIKGYGFVNGEWKDECIWYRNKKNYTDAINGFKLVTDAEALKMLIKEAKKKGFVEGVSWGSIYYCSIEVNTANNKYYSLDRYGFALNGSYIMVDGKWATIIEEPLEQTMEQVSKKYGREVKIVKSK